MITNEKNRQYNDRKDEDNALCILRLLNAQGYAKAVMM